MKVKKLVVALLATLFLVSCGDDRPQRNANQGNFANGLGGVIGGTNISIANIDSQFPCANQNGGRFIMSAQVQLQNSGVGIFQGQAQLQPNGIGAAFGGNSYVGITGNNDVIEFSTTGGNVQTLTMYMCRDQLFNEQSPPQFVGQVAVSLSIESSGLCPFGDLIGTIQWPQLMTPMGPLTDFFRQVFIDGQTQMPRPVPGICTTPF